MVDNMNEGHFILCLYSPKLFVKQKGWHSRPWTVFWEKRKAYLLGKILTVDKINTALDLLLSQQLLINISFFSSNQGVLIGGDKGNIYLKLI